MAAQPTPRLSPAEYLEIERAALSRHEYFDGQMFAMAGGSYRQSLIIFNLASELRNALKDKPCGVAGQDLRTSVSADGLYTYPDVLVVCGEPRFVDDQPDTITNPTLIIEVLSPSTEAYDRGLKFAQYRKIESLREYVLVSQAEALVEVFRRRANGEWSYSEAAGLDSVCRLESVECAVALAEVYAKVTLGDATENRLPGAVDGGVKGAG